MPAPLPTPIGVGPRFRPPPALHGTCVRAPLSAERRVHLELFAAGRVVLVPAAIGLRDNDMVFTFDYYHKDIKDILTVRATNLAFEARMPDHGNELVPGTGPKRIESFEIG